MTLVAALFAAIVWQGVSWALLYLIYRDDVLGFALFVSLSVSTLMLLLFYLLVVMVINLFQRLFEAILKSKILFILSFILLGFLISLLINTWFAWDVASRFADYQKYESFWTGLETNGWRSVLIVSIGGGIGGLITSVRIIRFETILSWS